MHTFRKLPKSSPKTKTPDAMNGSKWVLTLLTVCELIRPDYKLWTGLTEEYQSHCTGGQWQQVNVGQKRAARRPLSGDVNFGNSTQYESTQPPVWLLKALLHNDCTAKVPVDSVMSAEAPWPELIQAHLSPFSDPPLSNQPPFG